MALQLNVKAEDEDMTDLDSKIEDESTFTNNATFGSDLVLNEYETVEDHSQENSDIIHTLIEEANEPSYVEDDQCGQQFLTLSQGNNRIAVNDNGTIVYTDVLAEAMDESIVSRSEDYFEASSDAIDEQYLQDNETASVSIDNVQDGTMLLAHDSSSDIIEDSSQSYEQFTIAPGGIISKTDGNNMITIQRSKAVKRPLATPSKGVVTKVYVQNNKFPGIQNTVTGRSMTFAQAQRLGILPSKIQNVISSAPHSQRIVVKKVVQPSSSNVVIRSPQKIMPAASVRDRITVTGIRPNIKISQGIRTNIPVTQLKTILTATAPNRAATLNKTFGGMTLQKVDGHTQQVVLRQGANISSSIKIPAQLGGKQHVQYVKIIGNSGVISSPKSSVTANRTIAAVSNVAKVPKATEANRVVLTVNSDDDDCLLLSKSPPLIKDIQLPSVSYKQEDPKKSTINIFDDIGDENVSEEFDQVNDENSEFVQESPQRIFEANGIRPKKPCNCTRSQCLKLYCECFANGEFCFECNCNNCFNNIEHEEERQNSIKSCLDRNPAAFRSKIKVAESDDEEPRQNNKGCNCKRSHCLKNYCECFETKVLCGKNCKCTSCRNTQDDMAAWVRGEDFDSGNDEREATIKNAPYMSQALAEALCQCIMAQAETSERKGEDVATTEQRIIEELGQRLVQIIGNRSKKDSH